MLVSNWLDFGISWLCSADAMQFDDWYAVLVIDLLINYC